MVSPEARTFSKLMPRAVLSQTTINYAKLGAWDGRAPVVMIHGLAASFAFWMHAADGVSRDHPVLLFDLRGHGRSSTPAEGYSTARMAEDTIELLESLGIRSATFAGHSFGGSVALAAALCWSGRLEALVLADTRLRMFQPSLKLASWPRWLERKEHLRELGFDIAEDDPEAGVRLLTQMAALRLGSTEDLPRWIVEFFGQNQSQWTAKRWLDLVERTTLLDDITDENWFTLQALQDFRPPLLALYGDHSPLLKSGLQLKEVQPRTDLRLVPGVGHFFPLAKPAAFIDPVREFLSSISATDAGVIG
jgi:pimeloyl-ACP methyl ester carboxylesterase